jgi:type II secretory pathway component PulJ
MQILHRGKINRSTCKDGFVLLRGLIAMFIVMICLAGILSSLAIISRRSAVYKEEVRKEIEMRNESVLHQL